MSMICRDVVKVLLGVQVNDSVFYEAGLHDAVPRGFTRNEVLCS